MVALLGVLFPYLIPTIGLSQVNWRGNFYHHTHLCFTLLPVYPLADRRGPRPRFYFASWQISDRVGVSLSLPLSLLPPLQFVSRQSRRSFLSSCPFHRLLFPLFINAGGGGQLAKVFAPAQK